MRIKIVFGSRFAKRLSTSGELFTLMLGLYVAHLCLYFSALSIMSVVVGNYDVFQIPLATANALNLLALSLVIPGWNYSDALNSIVEKPAHQFLRWFVLLTFPLSVIVTATAFLGLSAKLQILLMFLNAFHLECLVLFVKSRQ